MKTITMNPKEIKRMEDKRAKGKKCTMEFCTKQARWVVGKRIYLCCHHALEHVQRYNIRVTEQMVAEGIGLACAEVGFPFSSIENNIRENGEKENEENTRIMRQGFDDYMSWRGKHD